MADAPRDPRQLARDILSGKIRIEDLARERQVRGGEGLKPTSRPPAPRPPPAPMMRPASAPQRPVARPQPGSLNRPPVRIQPPPVKKARGPVIQQAAPPQVQAAPVQPKAAPQDIQSAAPPATAAQAYGQGTAQGNKRPGTANISSVRDMVKSRQSLRQGILLAEVLGKPLALRNE